MISALLLMAQAVTLVTFGDSLTAPREGVVTYSDVLRERLKEAGMAVDVINSGVPGNTSTQARVRFAADVVRRDPALVVIQLGANDAAIDVWKNPPARQPRVDLKTYEGNLRYFVKELRAGGSKIILMTPNRFAWTPRLLELYGKPPYRTDSDDGFNVMLDVYCDALRSVARQEDVRLIDPAKAVPASALLDGMHPSSEGHRIVADLLFPAVREMLKKP